ncbi:MAG: CZB domain-containing protein, partial [Sulfurimonas sp.]|nr:CZB domain-containing protein [Sulfurimonas sp.]
QQEANGMLDNSKELNKIANTSTENVQTLYTSLEQFNRTSESALASTRKMKNKNFILVAKIDHILFKDDALNHLQTDEYKEFSDSTQCRLGKWYSTDGVSQFKHSKSFKAMLHPHQKVHTLVHEIFELQKERGIVAAHEPIKEKFINMHRASDELFTYMDQMLEEEAQHQEEHINDGDIELFE